MMKSSLTLIPAGLLCLIFFQNCNRSKQTAEGDDTYTSGTAKFIADESFAPILDEEVYVFKAANPAANPQMEYRPENNAVNYLLADSARFAFLSRKLNADEIKTLQVHNLSPVQSQFASDGIAIIVNEASADTTTSVGEIKKMLIGQAKTDRSIVFDNPNSSLVRYLKELAGSTELKQKNIYALKSNKEVINYVSQHPDAIGITSYSWLMDPDTDYADAVKKIKVVGVKDENSKTPDQYYKPSQTTLYLKQYPLTRNLYMVNCTGKKGLGTGFELFIAGDKGQRIVLRSGLLPMVIPGRDITVHNNKL